MSILLDGTLGITTPGLTNTGTETIVNLTTTGNTILGDASTDTLNVGNGGLIKDASGNVGIGDTSPAAYGSFRTLSVKGTTTSAGGLIDLKTSDNASILQIYNTNALAVINQSSNLPLAFNTNSTERMRLDSSGNLGLGVTPSAWNSSLKALQIQTTGIAANNGSFANFSYNTYYDSVGYKYQISAAALMYQQTNSSGHIWYTAPSGTAGNAITFTQAMTLSNTGLDINATFGGGTFPFRVGYTTAGTYYPNMVLNDSGNLGVGTTTPSARISTSSGTALGLRIDTSTTAESVIITGSGSNLQIRHPAAGLELFNSGGSAIRVVAVSAGVSLAASATSWAAISDERQKTNLEPIADASNKLNTLRTVTGRYITDEETISRAFLIAQDVQAVLPEAVDTQDDEEGTLGLRYTDLIPLLIAGFKEQQAMIDELKAKVAALEAA